MTAMERPKAADRASFLLPSESPRPRKPKTTHANGIANFLWYSTSKRPYSLRPLPSAFSLPMVWSRSASVISRSPLASGILGKNSS